MPGLSEEWRIKGLESSMTTMTMREKKEESNRHGSKNFDTISEMKDKWKNFRIHSLKYCKVDLFIQRHKITNLSNQLTVIINYLLK